MKKHAKFIVGSSLMVALAFMFVLSPVLATTTLASTDLDTDLLSSAIATGTGFLSDAKWIIVIFFAALVAIGLGIVLSKVALMKAAKWITKKFSG